MYRAHDFLTNHKITANAYGATETHRDKGKNHFLKEDFLKRGREEIQSYQRLSLLI